MNPQELKILAELCQCETDIENLFKCLKYKDNPFVLEWADTNNVRPLHFDDTIVSEWNKEKVKLAKTYLKLVKKQIAVNKKKLNIKG